MIQDRGPISFLCMWLTSFPNTTCWRELFPTEYPWLTCQIFVDHICMGLYLLFINKVNLFIINKFIHYLIIIYSFFLYYLLFLGLLFCSMIYMSIFMPVLYCFNCYNTVLWNQEMWYLWLYSSFSELLWLIKVFCDSIYILGFFLFLWKIPFGFWQELHWI